MATFILSGTIEARNIKSVIKHWTELITPTTPTIHVVKQTKEGTSRADRLSHAAELFDEAKSIVDELYDEISNWKENLPENLQSSQKADDLESCASALEDIQSNMDSCDFTSVEFPGMF